MVSNLDIKLDLKKKITIKMFEGKYRKLWLRFHHLFER
jgi:hypothetical protein